MQNAIARHYVAQANRLSLPANLICWRVASLLAVQLVFSLIIVARPDIDTQMSAIFYRPGVGFPLANDGSLLGLRWLGRAVPASAAILISVLVIWRIARQQKFVTIGDRALAVIAGSFALGPGLAVNAIMKEHWARSRPLATELFGGTASFTPAWWPWGECQTNCSFVSGEASAAAVLMAFAVLCPQRHRLTMTIAVTLWMGAVSLNRMAFGAHYFSDVVLGCLVTLTIVYALKALLIRNPAAA